MELPRLYFLAEISGVTFQRYCFIITKTDVFYIFVLLVNISRDISRYKYSHSPDISPSELRRMREIGAQFWYQISTITGRVLTRTTWDREEYRRMNIYVWIVSRAIVDIRCTD